MRQYQEEAIQLLRRIAGSPHILSRQAGKNQPLPRRTNSLVESLLWNICLAGPIAQMQKLPNLSAFVAIFLVLGRPTDGLGEWMFGITDDLLNQVQGLHHGLSFLFCGSDQHCAAHLRTGASDDCDCAVGQSEDCACTDLARDIG